MFEPRFCWNMVMVNNFFIDISADDINDDEIPKGNTFSDSSDPGALAKSVCSTKNNLKMTGEDDMDGFQRRSRKVPRAKRKRASDIVRSDNEHSNADEDDMNAFKGQSSNTRNTKRERAVSDDETSYDDHAPISMLVTRRSYESNSEDEVKENACKQRLTRLRKLEDKNREDNSSEGVDEEVECEGERSGGFVTYDNENSNTDEEDVIESNTRSA